MLYLIKNFIGDESGQGMTEYAAILAFVGLLIALFMNAVSPLSGSVGNCLSGAANALKLFTGT